MTRIKADDFQRGHFCNEVLKQIIFLIIAISQIFSFVSYLQQDLQPKDLEKGKACDEPTQGKIVTVSSESLWLL